MVWKLPLTSYPLFNLCGAIAAAADAVALAPYFLDWLAHPNYDDYWKPWSIEEHFADINVPVFTIAAWYDIFQDGSLRNYIGIKAHGGTEAAAQWPASHRDDRRPCRRRTKYRRRRLRRGREFNENERTLDWYDYLFKGVQNEFATSPSRFL